MGRLKEQLLAPSYGLGHVAIFGKLSIGCHSKVRKGSSCIFSTGPSGPSTRLCPALCPGRLTSLEGFAQTLVLWQWLGLVNGRPQQENGTWDLAPSLPEDCGWWQSSLKAADAIRRPSLTALILSLFWLHNHSPHLSFQTEDWLWLPLLPALGCCTAPRWVPLTFPTPLRVVPPLNSPLLPV